MKFSFHLSELGELSEFEIKIFEIKLNLKLELNIFSQHPVCIILYNTFVYFLCPFWSKLLCALTRV